MITTFIDDFSPCLIENDTGNIVQTEVKLMESQSSLSMYNKNTGWYVDWSELSKENDIYALVIKGTKDVQGLVAVMPYPDMCAQFVSWMVAAPQNNPLISDEKKYIGVGGHLFAIAINASKKNGFDGFITGFASDKKLELHYIEKMNAMHIGQLHPYQFAIDESSANKILEVYTYEWSEDKL